MPSFHAAPSTTLSDRPQQRPIEASSDDLSRRRSIVLLGIDGAGKTTTATTLVASMRASGTRAQLLRNPGGRRWISRAAARFGTTLTPAWANLFESIVRCTNVLFTHARASGFHGTTVMDRHLACQLVLRSVRGLPQGVVLPWLLARLPRPDAIILIDVPADIAHARIVLRGEDSETHAYLESSRQAYLEIARAKGWHIIDGSQRPQQVALDVWSAASTKA